MKMNRFTLCLTLLLGLWAALGAQAQVKIGNNPTTISAGSLLELEHKPGSPKGFVPPRMTTAERTAIPTPLLGSEVYNIDKPNSTTLGCLEVYDAQDRDGDGSRWNCIGVTSTTATSTTSPVTSATGGTGSGPSAITLYNTCTNVKVTDTASVQLVNVSGMVTNTDELADTNVYSAAMKKGHLIALKLSTTPPAGTYYNGAPYIAVVLPSPVQFVGQTFIFYFYDKKAYGYADFAPNLFPLFGSTNYKYVLDGVSSNTTSVFGRVYASSGNTPSGKTVYRIPPSGGFGLIPYNQTNTVLSTIVAGEYRSFHGLVITAVTNDTWLIDLNCIPFVTYK